MIAQPDHAGRIARRAAAVAFLTVAAGPVVVGACRPAGGDAPVDAEALMADSSAAPSGADRGSSDSESTAIVLPDDRPEAVTPVSVAEGRRLFLGEGMCWACHGEDARGARGVGADLTDDDWWHTDGSYGAIAQRIVVGVPVDSVRNELRAAMPPRGGSSISDDQVRAVAAYVWTLRYQEKE